MMESMFDGATKSHQPLNDMFRDMKKQRIVSREKSIKAQLVQINTRTFAIDIDTLEVYEKVAIGNNACKFIKTSKYWDFDKSAFRE